MEAAGQQGRRWRASCKATWLSTGNPTDVVTPGKGPCQAWHRVCLYMKWEQSQRKVRKKTISHSRSEISTPLYMLSAATVSPWRRITQKLMNSASVFMSVLKAGVKRKRYQNPKIHGSAKCLQGLGKHKYAFIYEFLPGRQKRVT